MAADRIIAKTAFKLSLQWLGELKAAPSPLPHGLAARFQSLVPKRTPDEILATETDPNWFGYAETMREFTELLAGLPRVAFVEKRGTRA